MLKISWYAEENKETSGKKFTVNVEYMSARYDVYSKDTLELHVLDKSSIISKFEIFSV